MIRAVKDAQEVNDVDTGQKRVYPGSRLVHLISTPLMNEAAFALFSRVRVEKRTPRSGNLRQE